MIIGAFPVVAESIALTRFQDIMQFFKDEKWKGRHVLQSQYILQIARCNDLNCYKKCRINFQEFFPNRFEKLVYILISRKKYLLQSIKNNKESI